MGPHWRNALACPSHAHANRTYVFTKGLGFAGQTQPTHIIIIIKSIWGFGDRSQWLRNDDFSKKKAPRAHQECIIYREYLYWHKVFARALYKRRIVCVCSCHPQRQTGVLNPSRTLDSLLRSARIIQLQHDEQIKNTPKEAQNTQTRIRARVWIVLKDTHTYILYKTERQRATRKTMEIPLI